MELIGETLIRTTSWKQETGLLVGAGTVLQTVKIIPLYLLLTKRKYQVWVYREICF
jgi:hypothetical protein